MRTLLEIIDTARDGNKPTHDECYWAMLALDALWHFDKRSLEQLAHEPNRFRTPQSEVEESFNRAKRALNTSPQEWVGPNNDPANPDYQKQRRAAFRILDRVGGV